jgi:hypothetical protein
MLIARNALALFILVMVLYALIYAPFGYPGIFAMAAGAIVLWLMGAFD